MRRTFLLGGGAALTALILSRRAQAGLPRRIAFHHTGTGARFDGTWHDGTAPDPVAMAELSAVLADEGCPPRAFDPDTIGIIWEVAARTRLAGPLTVHSGYRTPQMNRRVHGAGDSQHLRASALDIGVPTGKMPAVADAALRLRRGGVGVYRQRGFIHIDSGTVRSWSDGGARVSQRSPSPREQAVERLVDAWRQTR